MSPILDSHVHLWNSAQLRYPWLDELPALNRPFQSAEFAAASAPADISKFIFIECGCEPSQSLAEVDWISALAKSDSRLKGVVAHASLERGEAARADLVALASRPLVKGVRRNLQSESDQEFCLRPGILAGVRLLAEFGFTFDLCIRHDQLPAATELACRVPEVVFVLDHLAKPAVRDHLFEPWASDLAALAALPNVVAKTSGLTTEADWKTWQPAELAPYLQHAFACFGPDRLLFGSDWPVMTLATGYPDWIKLVQTLVPFSDEQDQVHLFRTNAERIYRV
jgi:L-fuconolactonase